MSNKTKPADQSAQSFLTLLQQRKMMPSVILDVGSRDGGQAIELAAEFPEASVFAFEALPASAELCRRITHSNPKIEVIEAAVHDRHGDLVPFFPIQSVTRNGIAAGQNSGASSLYRAINGEYPDHFEQSQIHVQTIRLDKWAETQNIKRFDVVWMDLQGAELLALRGMGKLLDTVQAIQLEMTLRPIYDGQSMYTDVHAFLLENGFRQVSFIEGHPYWWGDGQYIRV